jgi:hypothetical protein
VIRLGKQIFLINAADEALASVSSQIRVPNTFNVTQRINKVTHLTQPASCRVQNVPV